MSVLAPEVLVAHADAAQRARIVHLLAGAGYDVVACATAAEALALIAVAPRAALVIGAELADMEGVALMQACRSASETPIAIVVASIPRIDSAVRALRAGAQDYLPEPSDERLVDALRAALRERAP